jgi:integrase
VGPHVETKAGTVTLLKREAKNREPRTFYFTPRLRQILEAQWAEHGRLKKKGKIVPWVFHRGGTPVTTLTQAFKSACRKAGIPGRLPHDLRRSAVRRFVRQGIPDSVAMKLRGYKTRAVFDRHNIVSDADVRGAADVLGRAEAAS